MVKHRSSRSDVDHFLANMNRDRKENRYCDLKIRLASELLPCHRIVLMNRIKVNPEKEKEDILECQLDIELSTAKAALEFLYTFRVDVDEHNVNELLLFSDYYGIEDLRSTCECFLERQEITDENWFSFWQVSTQFRLPMLRKSVASFLISNFTKWSQNELFPRIDLETLQQVLSSDKLPVSDECAVLDVVRNWINFNKRERASRANDVLRLVRLPMISSVDELCKLLRDDPIFAAGECCQLITAAFDFLHMPARRWALQSPMTRPRVSTGKKETLIAVTLEEDGINFLVWERSAKQWCSLLVSGNLDLQNDRLSSSANIVCFDNSFFLLDRERGIAFQCSDLLSDSWKPMSLFMKSTVPAECVVTDSSIYLIGGKFMDRVSLDTRNCSSAASPPFPVLHPTLFFINGRIYVIGGVGEKSQDAVQHIQVFHCEREEWSLCKNAFPEPSCHMPVVCFDGIVYLLTNSGKLYSLDLDTFESKLIEDFKIDCRLAALTIFRQKIAIYLWLDRRVFLFDLSCHRKIDLQPIGAAQRRIFLFNFSWSNET